MDDSLHDSSEIVTVLSAAVLALKVLSDQIYQVIVVMVHVLELLLPELTTTSALNPQILNYCDLYQHRLIYVDHSYLHSNCSYLITFHLDMSYISASCVL